MTEETRTEDQKPPYLPFTTFWSFLAELGSKPLPPQIDRSMMSGKSGTDQANLFLALKFFELIDSKDNSVKSGLTAFAAADEDGRKRALGAMLQQRFPGQLAVSEQNGTEKLLLDSFESDFGYTGDTRRKAMTFFLHAARLAGIDLSAHFPVTRMGSGRPATGRPRRTPKKKTGSSGNSGNTGNAGTHPPDSGQGERVSVSFGDAGSVEVQVNVRWLELPDETFTALRRIITELRELSSETVDDVEEEDDEL